MLTWVFSQTYTLCLRLFGLLFFFKSALKDWVQIKELTVLPGGELWESPVFSLLLYTIQTSWYTFVTKAFAQPLSLTQSVWTSVTRKEMLLIQYLVLIILLGYAPGTLKMSSISHCWFCSLTNCLIRKTTQKWHLLPSIIHVITAICFLKCGPVFSACPLISKS